MGNAEENHRYEMEYWLAVVLTKGEIGTLRSVAEGLELGEEFDYPKSLAGALRRMADRAEACHNEDHSYDNGD